MEDSIASRIVTEVRRTKAIHLRAYLEGALGDATYSSRHRTIRFGQADRRWLDVLQAALGVLNHAGWIYREGKHRDFWILETSADLSFARDPRDFLGREEGMYYARGFFDAEGGMPIRFESRLYLQLAQRDRDRVAALKELLTSRSIDCGSIHNPSKVVDPDYWRFYVRADSRRLFLQTIGSWHPRKRPLMEARLVEMLGNGRLSRADTRRAFEKSNQEPQGRAVSI